VLLCSLSSVLLTSSLQKRRVHIVGLTDPADLDLIRQAKLQGALATASVRAIFAAMYADIRGIPSTLRLLVVSVGELTGVDGLAR
jgi:hypothetical protein